MTRRVALIGNPLRRRHSAIMHNAAFAAHGIDARFELQAIEPTEVGGFFEQARGPEWMGFGVTAPYKQMAIPFLDVVEAGAEAIGAVNNGVRRDDGSLVGFNTDADGFIAAVESMGVSVSGRPAVVFGAGGAARAVVWALLDSGAETVHVANRSLQRSHELAKSMAAYGPVAAASPDDDATLSALAACAIAVNATTVGMTVDDLAFDVTPLRADALVFDLVYVPPETPLVAAATARGLKVCNGLEMLVRQGEIAFERWTGIGSTANLMRAALLEWSGDPGTEA